MTNTQEQFEPLTAKEKVAGAQNKKSSKDEGIAIVPVPDDVALVVPMHPLGVPVRVWEYRSAQRQLIFCTCRFITADGAKGDRPLTYRQYKDGSKRWGWKSVETPRPLYGLDRLAACPDAPVLVCEGEKATDAAQTLFPNLVTVTSPNGAGSAQCADWQAMQGRAVAIWPDHDQEGKDYATAVAQLALKAGAVSVSIVQVPDGFPEKWDLADTPPDGFTVDDLQDLIDKAESYILKKIDYESLKVRAEALTKDSHPDEIQELIKDISRLGSLHRQTLKMIIKKKTGMPLSSLQDALTESNKSIEQDHLALARAVISEISYENLLSTVAHVWLWSDAGIWLSIPDRKLKQNVQHVIEKQDEPVSRSLVDGVTDVLKSEIYRPEHEWNLEQDAINFLNGELRWNGTAWILQPHCREHYLTTQVPHEYDPQALCPRFSKFLQEIFAGDPDAEDKTRALLEMIGYTLTCHTRFERFALLVGSGANGKSVVLDIIRLLVGKENVSAVQPSEFGNKFQRAHLHLKLANLVTEIREGAEIADAELKSIVSGELTTVEHKNKDPFDFRPYATCWFGTNHMPHTRDFSDALFRRALVMPFNNTFKAGVNADTTLKDKLAKELPGILNMALQAYGEALKRGSFTDPASCMTAKKEWRTEADQVAQFIAEMCSLEAGETSSRELYVEYEGWTKAAGINRKLNRKNFTNRLLRHGCELAKGAEGARMIAGIRLRPIASYKKG